MVTYLYCVLARAPADGPPAGLSGVSAAAVRSLLTHEAPGIEAWVSTVDQASLRVTGRPLGAQALLHNEVVEAALATGRTPVPARFGSTFRSDEACASDLAARRVALIDALNRLAGRVEMSILIVPPRLDDPAEYLSLKSAGEPSPGRRYLEVLRARARREVAERSTIDTLAKQVEVALRGIAIAEARSWNTAAGIGSIAHLVSRQDVARYREVISAVHPPDRFRLVLAGPRAPYRFTGSDAFGSGHDSSSPDSNE